MATITRILHLELHDEDGTDDPISGQAVVGVEADVGVAEKKAGLGKGRITVGCSIARADLKSLLAIVTLEKHALLDDLPAVPDVKPALPK